MTSVTQEQISESANWIHLKKKEHPELLYQRDSGAVIDITTLNTEQQVIRV